MVPMHGQNDLEAFHEPPRPSNRSLRWKSGAEDARTPDASRPPGVSERREASGVRPIYRRFRSGAGRPAVHGPNNACEKRKEGFTRSAASYQQEGGSTLAVESHLFDVRGPNAGHQSIRVFESGNAAAKT